jgi:ankyrin repeat protein
LSAVAAEPALLQKRDPAGATPLHFLVLMKSDAHLGIFYTLAATPCGHARLADQYTHDADGSKLYFGENLLHIAVVNRNLPLAASLLDLCPALLSQRAVGTYFDPPPVTSASRRRRATLAFDAAVLRGPLVADCCDDRVRPMHGASANTVAGKLYYGEYPLSFAVATNQGAMVRMLLSCGADMAATDREGNTAFHLAVIAGHLNIYRLLRAHWKQTRGTSGDLNVTPCSQSAGAVLSKCPSELLNHYGLNCVEIAAAIDATASFEALLDDLKEVQWKFGPVECSTYPLAALNRVLDVVIEEGSLEVLYNSECLRDLVFAKWHKFAKRKFYFR